MRGHVTLGLAEVLEDLAEIGWNAQWTCVRASDVGAPHHRERLFILAYPNSERPQAQRQPGGQAQEIAWDNDMLDFLAGLNGAVDIGHELRNQFGEYGPAILTWALITGTPPPPLLVDHPVRSLHPRFPESKAATNPEFIEWMMGLPAGWVTGVPGLVRTQILKALGNGVCPQQGAAALREILSRA